MRKILACFDLFQKGNNTNNKNKKSNKLDIELIQIEEIRKQQKKILDLVSEENFQGELIKTIHSDIENTISKQSNLIKKRFESQLGRDIKEMEFAIITNITGSIQKNIEKKLENTIQNSIDSFNSQLKNIQTSTLHGFQENLESIVNKHKEDILVVSAASATCVASANAASAASAASATCVASANAAIPISTNSIEIQTEILEPVEEKMIPHALSGSRYCPQYSTKDDVFWGIGLENETYLKGESIKLHGSKIIQSIGRERYSVDYTKNYHLPDIKEAIKSVYLSNKNYLISRMLNAHSLSKIDRNGEHQTTYEKEPKPNPKFLGKTVLEEWFEYDPEMKEALDPNVKDKTNIFFDGDTIEFITEKFYKTNSKDIVQELISRRNWFINKFNQFKIDTDLWSDYGMIDFVKEHPGLNIFRSAPNKIVLFNNSTIHIHITLPTAIKNGIITDEETFLERHKKAMQMIQWFQPFLICTLGSPDIFQFVFQKKNNDQKEYFSGGSMRNTISRYIGIGTYPLETMETGKILNKSVEECRPTSNIWWRDLVKGNLLYKLPEDQIGLDFNFRKHYQSGLEFRILDGIPMTLLKDVIDILLLLCEHSYDTKISKASSSNIWNLITYRSMSQGYLAKITIKEALEISRALKIPILLEEDMDLEEFYWRLLDSLFEMYPKEDSKVLQYMTKKFNKINRWENFNRLQCIEHIKSLEAVE